MYNGLGDRQQALTHYQQALPSQREVGDRDGEATTCYNIAMIHRVEGNQFVVAAIAGVQYVLDRYDGDGRLVTVMEIHDTPVDTVPDDITDKFAAAVATCQALDVELDPALSVGPRGIVFPPLPYH